MNISFDINAVDWTKNDGLIPAVVQDARSMRVLMLGYVSKESLQKMQETGLVTFYSRSKQRLWQKGETSGHVLRVYEAPSLAILADLAATIHARRLSPEPGSYTAKLFDEGITRIAQKVGEEAVETALAATTKSQTLAAEAADLLYHLLVLLEASDVDWLEVLKVLHMRANKK